VLLFCSWVKGTLSVAIKSLLALFQGVIAHHALKLISGVTFGMPHYLILLSCAYLIFGWSHLI
jgi:hypothetical protein